MITGSGPKTRGQSDLGQRVPAWLAREIRALFAEARRRRRRRLAMAAAALASAVLAGGAVAGYVAAGGGHGRPGSRASWPSRVPVPRFGLPSALVAWFDANGVLRIGNVATLAQRRVAHVPGDPPCCQMVRAGQRIYWAGRFANRDYIQDYDLATGVIHNAAPGWAVFPSASGRSVYIAQSASRLLEVPVGGPDPARLLTTPPGWHLVPLPWAVAGGIVLSGGHAAKRPAIGVWQPSTGRIQVLGHGQVQATWTQSEGHSGLIAWQPAGCPLQHCPIEITSLPSRRTLTVRSPGQYGFLGQGNDVAFSPDGAELAGFISINRLSSYNSPLFVPALVNTSTGTVRLVRRTIMSNGELSGWLLWLPGGERLLAGPARSNSRYAGYAVNARTAAARPFTFFPGESSYPANASFDIGYGAVLIPAPD